MTRAEAVAAIGEYVLDRALPDAKDGDDRLDVVVESFPHTSINELVGQMMEGINA